MATNEKIKPTITDLLSLDMPSLFRMSPSGDKIAYGMRQANWNKNFYETIIYIYYTKNKKTVQLSRSGIASDIHWINNESLAAMIKFDGEKSSSQIYLFENLIGEPLKITEHKNGIQSFRPFANGFLYKANDPKRNEKKKRKDEFGTILH
ncbi:MAG: hypothetical protein FK733_15290, partial [Asgard group archaeon]|nr:hypothetical protein [Asgard group archaeon]